MLHRKRLELALERIKPAEWERFEQFASAFLTSEFSGLRTVASPSGDEGRDAELYSPAAEASVVLQYSVSASWKKKIKDTAKKIRTNLPSATQLIYVTNQKIGASADELKRELRTTHSIALDIRDDSFFLDRFEGDTHRETVAANFARDIVDPYLQSKEVIEHKGQALTSSESRAALVFLELQWEDDTRDKGLTKTAFDGLVRTALRNTHADSRLTRKQIHEFVASVLSTHELRSIVAEVDKSLSRLTKRFIRHYDVADEFCLTHDESERLKGRLAEIELEDEKLRTELTDVLRAVVPESEIADTPVFDNLLLICRTSVEKYLLQRGESFVAALETGQLHRLGFEALRSTVENELAAHGPHVAQAVVGQLTMAVERVLTAPGYAVSRYLRGLADTYTLLAFLRETPDVQNAVRKMFSFGEIWLDTSMLLPLFAEELVPAESWQFRRLIKAAAEAGLRFKVTRGVIEEVERHMNRSAACASWAHGTWRGNYPYLFSFYIANGSSQAGFSSWLSNFRGEARPQDDIQDFLLQFFNIATEDIGRDANQAPPDLRHAVKEVWLAIHTERRNRTGQPLDPILALRLAEHDTENYVGAIMRRRHEGTAALGYTCWWLTLDHMAFEIRDRIANHLTEPPPPAPVMSADFLTNYLTFGPLREKVAKGMSFGLPVALDPVFLESLTPELVSLAATVRTEASDLPEHIIRRKVRDALDSAKRRTGDITKRGLVTRVDDVDAL